MPLGYDNGSSLHINYSPLNPQSMDNTELFNQIVEMINEKGTATRGGVPMFKHVILKGEKDGKRYCWTLHKAEAGHMEHYINCEYQKWEGHGYRESRARFYDTDKSFLNAIKRIVTKYDEVTARNI
jgi:hypothetical protein